MSDKTGLNNKGLRDMGFIVLFGARDKKKYNFFSGSITALDNENYGLKFS